MKYPYAILFALITYTHLSAEEIHTFHPCGIELDKISTSSGRPGDTFVLYGRWGDSQGDKLPRINKGRSYNLQVISWSNTRIIVKIPDILPSGMYRVGVYCNPPEDPKKMGAYGTHWMDFEIIEQQ